MKWILFFVILSMFSGCGMKEREASLKKKEAELSRRELELVVKEEALRLKEEALQRKAQKLDSTQQDSALFYNPNLVGWWNVRMVCTETTCPGSAIGDTKTESWDISYQNKQIIAKAMTYDKLVLVRTYTGTYKNNILELTDHVELTTNAPATKMVVRLTLVDNNTMEGQREIIRTGDCRIVYSLQLNKES